MSKKIAQQILFGVVIIPSRQIFVQTKSSYGMINHRPFVPGHVLMCSKRPVAKLQQLQLQECTDLFHTAQKVSQKLQLIYQTSYQIFLQNGQDAGQTVSHVHLHLMPKIITETGSGLERKNDYKRSVEDMAVEAQQYRHFFAQTQI